jgi:peroxiredoxin Q/BCP
MEIRVGDPMPDIEGRTATGETVRLADYRGTRNVVLYFYPRDLTPGCTREAIDFDRRLEEFAALDTAVLGMSVDPPERHERFIATCGLRFPLLSDAGGEWSRRLGILGERGTARRTTFVVDKEGIVRKAFAVQHVDGHVDEVLEAVREIRGQE